MNTASNPSRMLRPAVRITSSIAIWRSMLTTTNRPLEESATGAKPTICARPLASEAVVVPDGKVDTDENTAPPMARAFISSDCGMVITSSALLIEHRDPVVRAPWPRREVLRNTLRIEDHDDDPAIDPSAFTNGIAICSELSPVTRPFTRLPMVNSPVFIGPAK